MNILKIDVDVTSIEGHKEVWDLMEKNQPCVAFIRIRHWNESFKKDGYATSYFVGIQVDGNYLTVSCGKPLYELALQAMYEGEQPLEVDYETDPI